MTDSTTVTQDEYYARVPKAVVYHPDLSGNDVRVYALLSERAGSKRRAWPGVRRIAKDIGMSPTTVQSALDKLEDLKLINVERSAGMVNHYHLPLLGTVPESDTPPYQELEQTVPESGTELDQRTTPSRTSDLLPSVVDHAPKRNDVWDSIALHFGEATTEGNRKLRGKLVRSLESAGATGDEIALRIQAWPFHFPDATLTETALEKHWDRLGRPPARASKAEVERFESEVRLAEGEQRARRLDRGLPA